MSAMARLQAAKSILAAVTVAVACLFSLDAGAADAADAASAIPHFAASQRCPGDASAEMKYDCDFLKEIGARDLQAPPGARVYRETWLGPLMGPMHEGVITLTISADGSRTLQTPWRRHPYRLA